jgi:phenylacetate-CoA ligase
MAGQSLPEPRRALTDMLAHAAAHSPHYSAQPWAARLRSGLGVRFGDIPITDKSEVRADTARFFSEPVAAEEGEVKTLHTSGSTGEPLTLRMTLRANRINEWQNAEMRSGWNIEKHRLIAHLLNPQRQTPSGTLVEGRLENGGHWWNLFTVDSRAAFDLLRRSGATAVWGFPSVILGALQHSVETSHTLPLKLVWTISEIVPEELRERIAAIPGCRLADQYGCVEAGIVAVQCPLCDAYHPAGRQLHLELITDEGRLAEAGEMGRVIVTPFFNRAMPLVRYDTGDRAIRASTSRCPRSPFSIHRIVGRQQNLFKLPDGRRIVPRLPVRAAESLGLRRFKLYQKTLSDVELHYVPRDPQAEIDRTQAQEMIDFYMAPGFKVRCVKVAEIPRAPNGKYLMHESFV